MAITNERLIESITIRDNNSTDMMIGNRESLLESKFERDKMQDIFE